MIDISKVISESLHEGVQAVLSENKQAKPDNVDEQERLIQLLLRHSSILLRNYHVALREELRRQGIQI